MTESHDTDHEDTSLDFPVVIKEERDITYSIPANVTLTEAKQVTRKATEVKVVMSGQAVWSRIVQERGLIFPRPLYEKRVEGALKRANKVARKLGVISV